jgi:hypothetical protein
MNTVEGWRMCSAFAELRKAKISFVMPVCPSVCLAFRMEQDDEIMLEDFSKNSQIIQISLKPDKNYW